MPVYLVPIENGRTVIVDKAVILFGRNADCDVVFTRSRKVSRKHCCLAQVDTRLFIRDLGSLNGVWVNGHRVRRQAEIKLGDELAIGDVRYRVQTSKQLLEPGPGKDGAKDGNERAQKRIDPVDISQHMPVIIPEDMDSEDMQLESIEPSLKETPDAFRVVEVLPDDDEDEDDDIYPIPDSNEFQNSGSRF